MANVASTRASAEAAAKLQSYLFRPLQRLDVHKPLPAAAQEQQTSTEADGLAGSPGERFASFAQRSYRRSLQQADKTFTLDIGAKLSLPTKSAKERPQLEAPAPTPAPGAQVYDPFEGLPFRQLAERMGEKMLPAVQAMREEQRASARTSRSARQQAAAAPVVVPTVPHVLPFTRWAASSEGFRSTFIAEEPKDRKKVRLSWYHPDDTMVPRGWWRQGLLADLKYYMPFGLGGGSKA